MEQGGGSQRSPACGEEPDFAKEPEAGQPNYRITDGGGGSGHIGQALHGCGAKLAVYNKLLTGFSDVSHSFNKCRVPALWRAVFWALGT